MFTENLEPGKETFKLIATVDKDDDTGSRKPIPCYFIVGKFQSVIIKNVIYINLTMHFQLEI